VRELVDSYGKYLYPPRLRDRSVLVEAIANGISALTWREDTFAYAQAFDEEADRYRGLVAGRHANVVVDDTAVLVKPEAAAPQLEAEVPEAEPAGPGAGPAGEGADAGDGGGPSGAEGVALTRFYGRVGLDPVRFLRQMSTISDELVAHLGNAGAKLRLTLELEAESPEGFPEDLQRTITENAATLKFESHEFEGRACRVEPAPSRIPLGLTVRPRSEPRPTISGARVECPRPEHPRSRVKLDGTYGQAWPSAPALQVLAARGTKASGGSRAQEATCARSSRRASRVHSDGPSGVAHRPSGVAPTVSRRSI